ncbi:MAG: FAD-dependent oxidoreductase [Alphaproteobacteria bacterium]|nr:FAD-dependent oxidoreductase [Alphaproteobacteria bacterium]
MPPDTDRSVTVVGAGIVGMATACYLLRDGHKVTVIDRGAPGEGCSFGNAGGVSAGSCVPLALPGILKKVPGWLRDPEGPLHIRLAYLPKALPWLWRLLRASRPAEVERIADGLRALHKDTFDAYDPLLRWAGCTGLIQRRGQLLLYETEAELKADAFGLKIRRDRGVQVEILNQDELKQLEPALAPIFQHAAFLPEQGQCANPFGLVQRLAAQFAADGGEIERAEVKSIEFGGDRPARLRTDQGVKPFNRLVIAAGAWSGALAYQLRNPVPLESERGYHVTVADPGVATRIQAMWMRRAFVATPMDTGMRFAGTVELAGLDAPPNPARAKVLLDHGKRMVPGIDATKTTTWMGHRPGLPDTLPVIDRSPHFENVYLAFGHGHTGLIAGAVTGRIISDLIGGRTPSIDMTPYRIDRFRRS